MRPRLPLKRQLAVWRFHITHKWRELRAAKYTGGGSVEISKIPDDDLVYRVFDYIFQNWMAFDKSQQDYDTSRLTPSEKAVWYAWDVDCEISNGGFNQYFFNKATRPMMPVVEAYSLLRADSHQALFLDAMQVFHRVAESHVAARRSGSDNVPALLQSFSETYEGNPLNDLDSRYYSISPGIETILCCYIREHADDFKRQ